MRIGWSRTSPSITGHCFRELSWFVKPRKHQVRFVYGNLLCTCILLITVMDPCQTPQVLGPITCKKNRSDYLGLGHIFLFCELSIGFASSTGYSLILGPSKACILTDPSRPMLQDSAICKYACGLLFLLMDLSCLSDPFWDHLSYRLLQKGSKKGSLKKEKALQRPKRRFWIGVSKHCLCCPGLQTIVFGNPRAVFKVVWKPFSNNI